MSYATNTIDVTARGRVLTFTQQLHNPLKVTSTSHNVM